MPTPRDYAGRLDEIDAKLEQLFARTAPDAMLDALELAHRARTAPPPAVSDTAPTASTDTPAAE
jgi:hypothetical protein